MFTISKVFFSAAAGHCEDVEGERGACNRSRTSGLAPWKAAN